MGKDEFLREFSKLCSAYPNQVILNPTIETYWQFMRKYPIKLLSMAVFKAIDESDYFPPVSRLTKYMKQEICPSKDEVLTTILRIVKAYSWERGKYHPVITELIDDIGGIYNAKRLTENELIGRIKMYYNSVAGHYLSCIRDGRDFITEKSKRGRLRSGSGKLGVFLDEHKER